MSAGKIKIANGKLMVPNNPTIPFIEGDGTGAGIWAASVRVFDAAVEKAYGEDRKINWMEVYAGENSFNRSGEWLPQETLDAFNEYLVGIKEIDNQHKGLVIIINELFTYMTAGKAKEKLDDIFDHLTDYTKKHFSTEEIVLQRYAYPELDQHKEEHLKFIKKLEDLKSDFESNKITVSLEVLNFLKDWLLNHILVSDKKYAAHIKKFDV